MGEGNENRSGKRVRGLKLYDVKAVARFLDVSERRVRQLRDEKVIAEVRPGLYDLIDTNRRYINYLRKRNPESEETIDYNTERAKLVRAKRKNEEYELQLKENKLHAAEDIEDGYACKFQIAPYGDSVEACAGPLQKNGQGRNICLAERPYRRSLAGTFGLQNGVRGKGEG